MHLPPKDIQSIGNEIAIIWQDGSESYFKHELLRAKSPSAENMGERDIFGTKYGGTDQETFPGVSITGWNIIGNYAVRFTFSDGHNTGLFSWEYLKQIEEAQAAT